MFLRLTNMCKHQNKSVMYRGFSALDAFFQSVANELVGSQRSEDSNAKTFQVIPISHLNYYYYFLIFSN